MAANIVKLVSSDDKTFEVDVTVAMESEIVKDMIEGLGINKPIPLHTVSGDTLAKVVEYCRYHVENQKNNPVAPEDEIKAWDADFMKVDRHTLFALDHAANKLKINNLMDLTSLTMANMIKGKTFEEIRIILKISNDFTL